MDLSPLYISLKTSLVATVITFLIGVFVAYKMANYDGKLKSLLDGLFTLPLVLPPTVVGYILLVVFGRNGFIGHWLAMLNIKIIFTWTANVIAATTVSFPMMYRSARGAFELVDQNYVQSARTLGASEIRVFYRIVFPLAWPGIAAGTILAFARAMGEFGATLMIAGSITGRTKTMPIAIFFASEAGKDTEALIWVMIVIACSLLIIFFMNQWLDREKKR